jgi:hypothetical protein
VRFIHSALKSSGTSPNFLITFSVAEIAGGGITGTTERYCSNVTVFARQSLSPHYGRVWIEAFHRLPRRYFHRRTLVVAFW